MLRVEGVAKWYTTKQGRVAGARQMTFTVPKGQLFTLLGPSGCGKTTTMRCVAGLEHEDAGEIWLGGRCLDAARGRIHVSPHQRRIGMVFQSYALWPHMDVFNNVVYPLQAAGVRGAVARSKVQSALELVGMGDYTHRQVTELSGGQQQRVAVARAVVADVELLLLDEPLSNLDAKVRTQVRQELKELQQRLGITTLYVTHDQEEALAISDIMAVVHEGEIVEMGPAQDLYERPHHQFTAGFLGLTNFVSGTLTGLESGETGSHARADTALGPLVFTANRAVPAGPQRQVLLSVRPENIRLVRNGDGDGVNQVRGRITQAMFLGAFVDCEVVVGQTTLMVRAHPLDGMRVGDLITLALPPDACAAVQPSGSGVTAIAAGGAVGAHREQPPELAV